MITLTSSQRDFLDRYYTEYMKLEGGPTMALGAEHGFYREHFLALYDAYHRAWDSDFGQWGDMYLPASFGPLIFPWPSIQDLEAQLRAEGIEVIPLPKRRQTECPPSD